jgi:hypothetical protein
MKQNSKSINDARRQVINTPISKKFRHPFNIDPMYEYFNMDRRNVSMGSTRAKKMMQKIKKNNENSTEAKKEAKIDEKKKNVDDAKISNNQSSSSSTHSRPDDKVDEDHSLKIKTIEKTITNMLDKETCKMKLTMKTAVEKSVREGFEIAKKMNDLNQKMAELGALRSALNNTNTLLNRNSEMFNMMNLQCHSRSKKKLPLHESVDKAIAGKGVVGFVHENERVCFYGEAYKEKGDEGRIFRHVKRVNKNGQMFVGCVEYADKDGFIHFDNFEV